MEQDSPWKEAVEDLFKEFLAFFFPEVHCDIDFAKGYQFLDTELQKIMREAETGKRIVDKLVSVCLKDGTEKWLLIHIEIQGYEDPQFPERMYVYNYRIFDHLRKDVASLAVLTDPNPNFRPNEYRREFWHFCLVCKFPIVKLIDYWKEWDELEKNPNPFAIVVRAFLKTTELLGYEPDNEPELYTWKRHFIQELFSKGLERETVWKVLEFIDWIMVLSRELESEIEIITRTLAEGIGMPHITSFERLGIEKGIERSLPLLHQTIAMVLRTKFGDSGKRLIPRAYEVQDLDALKKLVEGLEHARDVAEVEKSFDEIG